LAGVANCRKQVVLKYIAMSKIDRLTIKGFKSIRHLENFEMRSLNVLIGANGTGKSNFISYFQMLGEVIEQRLQIWTGLQGSADRILSFGIKETTVLESLISFGKRIGYEFKISPTADEKFVFLSERSFWVDNIETGEKRWESLGNGHMEAKIKKSYESLDKSCYGSISRRKTYHFHDTGDTAKVKLRSSLHDSQYLRPDAANLAAFLYRLRISSPNEYQQIVKVVRLIIPFFDDFELIPQSLSNGEEQIRLLWRQKNSDYPLWPSQLSDGSLRFICLATTLLQPQPPSTIIIDEPELGLHPYAITLLGSLIRSASENIQIIISTQSVALVNEFDIEDLVVVETEDGATVFKRLQPDDFQAWLEEYSTGELWEKNVLGGRPK
jgi:predicted ATPase